jgi:hypothetical protein
LRFLKFKEDQISGFSEDVDAYKLFRDALQRDYPHLLEKFDEQTVSGNLKKRKWREEDQCTGFSFDFFS